LNLPDIVFSKWTRWNDRANLHEVGRPGVYVLAHFKAYPSGNADLLAQEIIYVGVTCDQSLGQRWNQFHHSAFEGKRGHGGGMTYWDLFHGKRGRSLFVAAFPVDGLDKLICDVFILYVERKLILEYALKWNARPKCNKE
jgi:hypothetical protein